MSPPGEGVDKEGDDGGGGERAGEVDAGQDVEAGRGRCIKKSVLATNFGPRWRYLVTTLITLRWR